MVLGEVFVFRRDDWFELSFGSEDNGQDVYFGEDCSCYQHENIGGVLKFGDEFSPPFPLFFSLAPSGFFFQPLIHPCDLFIQETLCCSDVELTCSLAIISFFPFLVLLVNVLPHPLQERGLMLEPPFSCQRLSLSFLFFYFCFFGYRF